MYSDYSKILKITIVLIGLVLVISGCTSVPGKISPLPRSDAYRYKPVADVFKAVNIEKKSKQYGYQQQTDNVIILLDDAKNNNNLKQTLANLLATLPKNKNYQKTIKTFSEINGRDKNKAQFNSLASVLYHYRNVNKHYKKTTLIILSEWNKITKHSMTEVQGLFNKWANRLCIYMIGVNNIHANQRLVKAKNCGRSVSAESLQSANKMANFVQQIFYTQAKDSDGDGIYDYLDRCPNTKADTPINWNGCARNSKTSNPRYLISKPKLLAY
ncbi:MAG: hypothetical protein QM479_11395 [Pseudomonadota bacterium]